MANLLTENEKQPVSPFELRTGEVIVSGIETVTVACQSAEVSLGQLLCEEDTGCLAIVTSVSEQSIDEHRHAEPLGKPTETAAALRSRLPALSLVLQKVAELRLLGQPEELGHVRTAIPLHAFMRTVQPAERDHLLKTPDLMTILLARDLPDPVLLAFLSDVPTDQRLPLIRQLVGLLHADWPRLRSLLVHLESTHG